MMDRHIFTLQITPETRAKIDDELADLHRAANGVLALTELFCRRYHSAEADGIRYLSEAMKDHVDKLRTLLLETEIRTSLARSASNKHSGELVAIIGDETTH